jgi:hypothetical protein
MFKTILTAYSLLLSLLFYPQSTLATPVIEQHLYQRTFGTEVTTMSWQWLAGNPERIKTVIQNEIDLTEMDATLATRTWSVRDQQQKTDLRIERQKNLLFLSGTHKGKIIDRWQSIDQDPWFQTISISFRPFLNRSEKTISFWTVRPDTLGVHKLSAVKKGIEELEIQGQTIQAERVELRLAGIGALIWKAHYWFRKTDGLFLRYVGPGGLPGTPKIIVELQLP